MAHDSLEVLSCTCQCSGMTLHAENAILRVITNNTLALEYLLTFHSAEYSLLWQTTAAAVLERVVEEEECSVFYSPVISRLETADS